MCDYERLVGYEEVAPPRGFGDLSTFPQTLAATLETMRNARREPVNQSVRGGTQTAGQLFGYDDVVIRAATDALKGLSETGWPRCWMMRPIRSCHANSAACASPARGRWSTSHRGVIPITSTPEGWASSAFYVALPGGVLETVMHIYFVGSIRRSNAPASHSPWQWSIHHPLFAIVTVIGFLTIGQAVAQEAEEPTSAQAETTVAQQAVVTGRNGRVCRYEDVTGSRMKRRICYTPKRWEARERAAQELVRELDAKPIGRNVDGG